MNIHDKSQRRGLAFLIAIFLFLGIFIYSKCSSDKPVNNARASDSISPTSQPIDSINSGKLVSDRDTLTHNIKQFDPSLSEFENLPAANTIEATDVNKNRVQMEGRVKDLKSVMWIFNHKEGENPNKTTIKNFKSFANLLCGMQGGKWFSDELKKRPTNDAPVIEDNTIIDGVYLIFFNDFSSTLSLKITTEHIEITPIAHKDSVTAEKIDFKIIESVRGDVYNNRGLLIKKLKAIDPTADFTGNYSEGSDKADDEFDAPDKFSNDFQLSGSKKHVKEVNFTYRPNPYFDNSKEFGFKMIIKTGKLLCNKQGENFTKLYLAAIKADPNTALKDSAVVDDKKMFIEYETQNKTINLIVTHK